jgi:hypothetical protein
MVGPRIFVKVGTLGEHGWPNVKEASVQLAGHLW